jgi:TRAP-type uncharacterized transport system fused permease subunit
MTTVLQHPPAAVEDAEQIVKEADLGGREPVGVVGVMLAAVAGAWSLFQVWYASPLPFTFGFGILNDTEARAVHLAFAVFLAFCAYPAFKRSSRQQIPWADWILALVGAFCASSSSIASSRRAPARRRRSTSPSAPSASRSCSRRPGGPWASECWSPPASSSSTSSSGR